MFAPGTFSLTGDWARGDNSKRNSYYNRFVHVLIDTDVHVGRRLEKLCQKYSLETGLHEKQPPPPPLCKTNTLFLVIHGGMVVEQISRVMRKPTFWFPTWSDKKQVVQPQKMARGLKFGI